MGNIKPIETIYNGYRFRSRLEARWAVFFDTLGVKYEYEPQGFQFNGTWYLPDFKIYDVEGEHDICWRKDIYVEVKGEPDSQSAKKVYGASYGWDEKDNVVGIPIWVVGNIPDPDDYVRDMERQREERCNSMHKNNRGMPTNYSMCSLCINCFGTLDGDSCYEFSLDYTDHLILHGADSNYSFGRWSDRVSDAFRAARQARFEHGEKG